MKFILQLSLEHMTFVKIAAILWNQDDIRQLIGNFMSALNKDNCWGDYDKGEWKKIDRKVTEKISNFPLSNYLKEKLSCYIEEMGGQILKWFHDHSPPKGFFYLGLPAEFCFTPHGVIDRKKTAELLIKDERLESHERYHLACIYCLEDAIPILWSKKNIPVQTRRYYPKEMEICICRSSRKAQWFILKHWNSKMVPNQSEPWNRAVKLTPANFELIVESGFEVAAEYFLKKLTPEEKAEYMRKIATSERIGCGIEVSLFLLSQMDDEQQVQFFIKNSSVMGEFLNWPLQNFFLQIADCVWDFMSKWDFLYLSMRILRKIKTGCKNYDYSKLYETFWKKSECFKTIIFDYRPPLDYLLSELFELKDFNVIRLMFRDASFEEKRQTIYPHAVRTICRTSILPDELDFLKYLVQGCLHSDEEKIKFKKEFEEDNDCKIHVQMHQQEWDELFSLPIGDYAFKRVKRNTEEGDGSSSPKRFRRTPSWI